MKDLSSHDYPAWLQSAKSFCDASSYRLCEDIMRKRQVRVYSAGLGRTKRTRIAVGGRELMLDLIHRVEPIRHRSEVKLLHLHLFKKSRMKSRSDQSEDPMSIRYERSLPFCVSVPVLSLKRYSTLPSSSGRVEVRTMVDGMSLSFSI
jgi:hypothetical protein